MEKIKHFTKIKEALSEDDDGDIPESIEDDIADIFGNCDDPTDDYLKEKAMDVVHDYIGNNKISKQAAKKLIKDVEDLIESYQSIDEDAGGAPAEGAATLSNTVGRSSFDFGNNPENGNSDQRRGSGEPIGQGGSRELTPEEQEMLDMSAQLSGGIKILDYEDFKSKAIKKYFTTPKQITEAINAHFGDFGQEAHKLISKVPVINGLLDIRSINEALSVTYRVNQINKVIDAVRNQ